MTTDEIVKGLAAMDPGYDDGYGSAPCFFCLAMICCDQAHEPDCIWAAAKKITEPKDAQNGT